MTSGLTIITPGGLAMASEEVFAFLAQCQTMSAALDSSAWRLHMVASSASAVRHAASALHTAQHSVNELAQALHQLAARAAEQEGWRQRTLQALVDDVVHGAVSVVAQSVTGIWGRWVEPGTPAFSSPVVPRSHIRGRVPEATQDDVAAILLGPTSDHAEVSVTPISPARPVTPALTMAERITRIPDTETPIRIETYHLPGGGVHADVFIAGTDEWGMGSGTSVFDMESNLNLVAGHTALSAVATTHAMRMAGVKPGDSVTFIGHSQGGAVAGRLAESGLYRTAGLLTVGSPTGTIPLHGDYPAMVIEHTNDIVPALGGERLTTQATVVTRNSGHALVDIVGAHSAESYQQTAALIDRSSAPELATWISRVPAGEGGLVSIFSATRLPGQ